MVTLSTDELSQVVVGPADDSHRKLLEGCAALQRCHLDEQ